jgi:hypothetical protein
MHQLSLLTGSTDNANNRVVCQLHGAADPPETAAFAVVLVTLALPALESLGDSSTRYRNAH